jgi:hypothetical protein
MGKRFLRFGLGLYPALIFFLTVFLLCMVPFFLAL